jgi:hypothetical protein
MNNILIAILITMVMATVATADGHPYAKWENEIKFSQFDNIDLSDTANNIRLGWSQDKWYAEIGKQNDGEEVTEFGVKFKNMGGISGLTLKTKIESERDINWNHAVETYIQYDFW